MMEKLNLDSVITEFSDLYRSYIFRNGFAFTAINEPANVYDAIVIRNPSNCDCWTPKQAFSSHTLEEHIDFVNCHKIEKALIIAEDISFITQCSTLKYLNIVPSDSAPEKFDYSPLYEMPEINWLDCRMKYGGPKEHLSTKIDCSRINGLKELYVRGNGCTNYNKVESLEELYFSDYKGLDDFRSISQSKILKKLRFVSCSFSSLDGIEDYPNLQSLDIWYNRKLANVSALKEIAGNLRGLSIENCPKISDFSVLSSLNNLETLSLEGNNEIPSLRFLNDMKKLRFFNCTMNITDGDITPCLSVPYVNIKGRKHYNYQNKDLPKNADPKGFIV